MVWKLWSAVLFAFAAEAAPAAALRFCSVELAAESGVRTLLEAAGTRPAFRVLAENAVHDIDVRFGPDDRVSHSRQALGLEPDRFVDSFVSVPGGLVVSNSGRLTVLRASTARRAHLTLPGLHLSNVRSFEEMRSGIRHVRVFAQAWPVNAPVNAGYDGPASTYDVYVWDFVEGNPAKPVARKLASDVSAEYAPVGREELFAFRDVVSGGAALESIGPRGKNPLGPLNFADFTPVYDMIGFFAQAVPQRSSVSPGDSGAPYLAAHVLARRNGVLHRYEWTSRTRRFEEVHGGVPEPLRSAQWNSLRITGSASHHGETLILSGHFEEPDGSLRLRVWQGTNGKWEELPAPHFLRTPSAPGTNSGLPPARPKPSRPVPSTGDGASLPADARKTIEEATARHLRAQGQGTERVGAITAALFLRLHYNAQLGLKPDLRYARWTAYLVSTTPTDAFTLLATPEARAVQRLLEMPVAAGRESLVRFRRGGAPADERLAWDTLFAGLARYMGLTVAYVRRNFEIGKGEAELEPGFLSDVEIFLQTLDPLRGLQTEHRVRAAFFKD